MLDSTVVNLALTTIQVTQSGSGEPHRSCSGSSTPSCWRWPACCSPAVRWATCSGAAGRSSPDSRCSPAARWPAPWRRRLALLIGARACSGRAAAPSCCPARCRSSPTPSRDPRERARAIGIWAGISGLSLAIGPLVGGSLVDRFGWQSIFWINVPIGVVAAIVLALLFVPESSDRAGRSLDLAGQVTRSSAWRR